MRKLLLGTVIAAVFAAGFSKKLQAGVGDGACGTMYNWIEVVDYWYDNEWHSSASSVISEPGRWRSAGPVGNVEYLHSPFAEGFVDSLHHPSCTTNG